MIFVSARSIETWTLDFLNAYDRKGFRKAGDHPITGERSFLKLIKYYYLGRCGLTMPEPPAKAGRFDFSFGNIAVEIVVKNSKGHGNLALSGNDSEMIKLRRHRGRSLLLLINMEQSSKFKMKDHVSDFREHTMGKGNHRKNPILLIYINRPRVRYRSQRFVLRRS